MNNFLIGNILDFINFLLLEIFYCVDNSLFGMIFVFLNIFVFWELIVVGNELIGLIFDLVYFLELDVFYCNNNNLFCFFFVFICGLDVFLFINNLMMFW